MSPAKPEPIAARGNALSERVTFDTASSRKSHKLILIAKVARQVLRRPLLTDVELRVWPRREFA
jgi:hypothetical protein